MADWTQLTGFLGTRVDVVGDSMAPTYPSGSRALISRVPLWLSDPARGNIVVFRSPAVPDRVELKRIIGEPGEMISWRAGQFLVGNTPLDEPYAKIPRPVPGDDSRCCRLGRDEYFLAGDNRLHSTDSRHYGPVRREAILGKTLGAPTRTPPPRQMVFGGCIPG